MLAGCAVARPAPQAGTAAKTGVLKVTMGGRSIPVKVALAPPDIDPGNDHVVTSLGTRGPFLLLSDSYASRGQGLSRCQAGHETWVRLIDIRTRTEKWSKLVESCLHDVMPGDPVASWAAEGRDFAVNLLSEPDVRVTIHPDGRIVAGR